MKKTASLAAAILCAAPAAAEIPASVASAELLPGWRDASGDHVAAVRITLAPGWKTYWRSPGDAGIPPYFDWTGSGNLSGVTTVFPVPYVFHQNGVRSVGYSGEVILPLRLTPSDPDAPIRLTGDLEIGVCEDVCIPVSFDLAAELPLPGYRDDRIDAALDNQPASAAASGVSSVTCTVEPIPDGIRLTARIVMPPIGRDEVAVLEMPDPAIWVSEAEMSRDAGTLVAVAEMVPPSGKPFLVDRSDVRITVLSGDRGVDIRGCTGS
jgi:DsbC/DsbD-like thiol-disulfide interchange protein